VNDAKRRKWEASEQPIELGPVQFTFAMSATKPPTPRTMHQIAKVAQRLSIARDSVIGVVPANLLTQDSLLVVEPLMSIGSTPLIDGLDRTSQTSGHRFAFDDPVPVSRTAPVTPLTHTATKKPSRRLPQMTRRDGIATRPERKGPATSHPTGLSRNRRATNGPRLRSNCTTKHLYLLYK
jgi:hypothetical protein